MHYTSGDQRICYEVHGTGPDVLFMHGLGADRGQAEHCLASLDGFRVITLDMPGHGESTPSGRRDLIGQVGFAAYARVAGDLLRYLGVTSAFLGGISMGAGIALKMAVDSPELARGLVLARPAWVNAPARPHLDLLADLGDWMADGGAALARQRLVTDRRFTDMNSLVPLCAAGVLDTIQRRHVGAAPGVLTALVDDQPYTSRSDLAVCAMPALVVSGEHDPLHPRWVADELSSSLPDATSQVVAPRYVEPERHERAVADAIQTFLDHCVETQKNPNHAMTGGPT